jgi:hypothetical protein
VRLRFSDIERVEAPSVEWFRDANERPRKPIIVTGAIRGWKALSRWTPDYLLERHANARVEVRFSDIDARQLYASDPRTAFQRREADFATCVRAALEARPSARQYLQYCDIAARLPELLPDIGRPDYCPRWFVSPAFLWLCGSGTTNPLHYDLNHVLMAQVVGPKRYVLFAPHDSPFISTRTARTLWRTSSLDPANVDDMAWPLAGRSQPYECTLYPGEMLFIPYRYWHYASVSEFNISVSYWWEPDILTKLGDLLLARALEPIKLLARTIGRR